MYFKLSITLLCLVLASWNLRAQSEYQMKANTNETEIDFLSSYYQQDGNNSPVTGGIGTEELTDVSNIFIVNVPLDSINAVNVFAGADYYTSASTDNIDNNVSSASSRDVRSFITLAYQRKQLQRGETYGVRVGFSGEYDYSSVSAGLSYAKEFNEGNSELSLTGQAFFDQWRFFFPVELRGKVNLPTKQRQSYNLQLVYSQVLNKRLQMSLSGELIYMNGLLSTPFHRVYFSDAAQGDIERLPDNRLKIPFGIRLNYFPADNFIVRTYYRFYTDDWGIQAHTASIETPIKLSPTFTISPFYRYHQQTAADHFAPFETHLSTDPFYTSDYDLSELKTQTYGMGIRYAPIDGLGAAKIFNRVLQFKAIELRGAYYDRDTGLNGFVFSLNLKMGLKRRPQR